jgi:hypothetical protein
LPGGWTTRTVPGDQFSPAVRYGDFGSFLHWKGSWMTREEDQDGSTFQLRQGDLAVIGNLSIMVGFPIGITQTVCQSTKTNYFGDYDDMIGSGTVRSVEHFIRSYPDSNQGCFDQWQFSSWHLHVSVIGFE